MFGSSGTADIPALMEAADVVVLPSLAEGLPLAIMEAFALGRPVVASSVGGVPELIEDGVTGRLVRAGDASALADAIRGVLDDRTAAARLGSAAATRYASSFTAERMVAETEALYDGLRGDHPDRSRGDRMWPVERSTGGSSWAANDTSASRRSVPPSTVSRRSPMRWSTARRLRAARRTLGSRPSAMARRSRGSTTSCVQTAPRSCDSTA